MGELGDRIASHNRDVRHDNLHVGPKGEPKKSCPLCRDAAQLADVERRIAAGKLVQG